MGTVASGATLGEDRVGDPGASGHISRGKLCSFVSDMNEPSNLV